MVATFPQSRSARSVTVIAGLVLLLVIVAVVISLTFESTGPASYPAGSPESAFQRYFRAFDEGDTETAYSFFTARVRNQMSYDDFTWYAGTSTQYQKPAEFDTVVRIERVERTDERAILHLTVEEVSGSGINVNRYTFERRIRMLQEEGNWKLDEPLIGVDSLPMVAPKSSAFDLETG